MFGFALWSMKTPLNPDVERVNCQKAFVKQNTALDYRNNERPTSLMVAIMVEIQLGFSQNSPEWTQLSLALFRCDVIRVSLKRGRPARRHLRAVSTVPPPACWLWHDMGLIKTVAALYWPHFSTEMTAIRTWSCWVTYFESSPRLCFP